LSSTREKAMKSLTPAQVVAAKLLGLINGSRAVAGSCYWHHQHSLILEPRRGTPPILSLHGVRFAGKTPTQIGERYWG
jgi:hypothetical protein